MRTCIGRGISLTRNTPTFACSFCVEDSLRHRKLTGWYFRPYANRLGTRKPFTKATCCAFQKMAAGEVTADLEISKTDLEISKSDLQDLISDLQERFDARASAKTKEWSEKYMKHVIKYRGLKTPQIRETVAEWREARGVDELPPEHQNKVAMKLMESDFGDDKLASALIFQDSLIPKGYIERSHLEEFARFFDDDLIFDWSTCDWFCVRVLKNFVISASDTDEMEARYRDIASWSEADNLWRKRASLVSFVNLAKKGDDFFPGFQSLILDSCKQVVQCQERFAQTAVGWVMREVGKGDEACLLEFCTDNLSYFSREGLRYALEKTPKAKKDGLMKQHKEMKRTLLVSEKAKKQRTK